RRRRRHQGEDRSAPGGHAQARRGGLRAGDGAVADVRRRQRLVHRRRGRRRGRVRGRRRGGEDLLMEEQQARDEQPAEESGEDRLAALEAERDDAVDRWKRTAADFDNFRKRALREREELVTLANERLVKDLLPILDDLERALEAAAQHQEAQ